MTISELMEKHSMKIIDISRKFDIPYRTVENWKSGERKPPQYLVAILDKIIELESRNEQERSLNDTQEM